MLVPRSDQGRHIQARYASRWWGHRLSRSAGQRGIPQSRAVRPVAIPRRDTAQLREAGIPDTVIEAVRAVTKIKGERLEGYCGRIRANPTTLRVKRADIEDNTDPARTAALPEQTRLRLAAKNARVRSLLGFPQQD